MSSCTHLDTVTVLELPESVEGCEDCLREGGVWLHLRICFGMWACWLLRRLAEPARDRPLSLERASTHPLAGAGRGLELVLRRRGRDGDRGDPRAHPHPAVADARRMRGEADRPASAKLGGRERNIPPAGSF
jgi:hypothetical protein